MNPKTFSKFLVNTFLFGIFSLCLIGISTTDVKAQKVTIKKDFCDSVGDQNTCNGNLEFMTPPGTVNFTITPATEDGTTTVGVVIDDEGNSSGTSEQIELANNTTFIVCEIVPAGFQQTPRPDTTTGGITQTTPEGMPNCIQFTTTNSEANFDLQFLNVAAATTAATAKVSGRVKDVNGKSAARVSVTITNVSSGEVLSTRTDMFGRYAFTELATGEDYLLRVFSGRRIFRVNEMFINLMEDLTDADFTTSAGMKNTGK